MSPMPSPNSRNINTATIGVIFNGSFTFRGTYWRAHQ